MAVLEATTTRVLMGEEQGKKVDGRTFRLFFLPVIHHKLHERRVMAKLATLSVSYMLAEGERHSRGLELFSGPQAPPSFGWLDEKTSSVEEE